ncbi:transporter substrate-binding domain-containing protein [Microvirga guangxiensis]|uniref:Amino acid ABC transporter substrate-binding protein, PAAT family (TC 3.A.1.3.-) n=1 Tax=Microvirga guangxiensis TaxID=549386 RepID=A0A1G5BYV5_9HYPH|nr:transporter substrate-binding domain-containing protein [Microvirga guangxiensis]SCX95311.1 amino acid ABC transporter substrate-binding protein, PAAT family (TC 3.A.1.3.-) [Microvirga guangxiensis]
MNAFATGRNLLLLASLLAALATPVAFAQDTVPIQKPAIRVAIEGAYPPFNQIDPATNELQGFEVDLLKRLCEVMESSCEIVQHEWDGIIKGLINREYDAIMSSLEITEKRQKRISFSDPYYRIPAVFIGSREMKSGEVTPQALAGKKIGTIERSDHETYLRTFYTNSEIAPYAKADEANLDLLVGRLDAVFGDELLLSRFLQSREGECCHVLGDAPADPAYRREVYGIGLRKDDEALRERFNRAIAQVKADGTYDRIRAKYFSFDIK